MKKSGYLILFSLLAGLWACENSTLEPDPNRLGFQFFPLSMDYQPIYEVEEINYRNDGSIDTTYYQLIDEFTDSTNTGQTIRLQGYRYKENSNGDREVLHTIQLSRNNLIAIQSLGNEQEVKLSFPVSEAKEWNGTPSEFEEDSYTYFKVFQPYELGDTTFNSTVEVIQEDNQDSVTVYDQRIEVYAANIGLIYKISSQLEFCRDTECLGLQQIEFGKTIRMRRKF